MNSGGRGRGRGSGDGRRELRRPMEEVVRGMAKLDPSFGENLSATPAPSADGWSSGVNRGEDESNVVLKSRLNVSAHEFVPKSTLNITAQEFVPRSLARNTSTWAYNQQQEQHHSQMMSSGGGGGGGYSPEAALSEAINTLTYSPGMFDVTAGNLAGVINADPSQESLQKIADVILETGIREINFRYTGARLCHYLSAAVIPASNAGEGGNPGFTDILLKKCTEEHSKLEERLSDNVPRVRSFTSFLAELFLQLSSVDEAGAYHRYTFLGEAVLKSLTKLTGFREKENLKCIAQTLKMAGSVLEYEEKNSSSGETPLMDKLMEAVKSSSSDSNVESHIASMMGKLPDLRSANWGLGPNGQVPHPPPHPVPYAANQQTTAYNNSSNRYNNTAAHHHVSSSHHSAGGGGHKRAANNKNGGTPEDSGTFYAPDGTELTPEEYEFMNAQIESSELAGFSSEDMPDDVEKAYEEFLNSQRH